MRYEIPNYRKKRGKETGYKQSPECDTQMAHEAMKIFTACHCHLRSHVEEFDHSMDLSHTLLRQITMVEGFIWS